MGDWVNITIESLADKELGSQSFVDGDWIESEHITNEGIRIIQTGNIGIGIYLDKPDYKKFISQKSFNQLNCKKVFPGDLLICRLADPIGRVCIVPNNEEHYVTAVDVVILRPNKKYSKNFLLYCLNDQKLLKLVNDQSGGSTRQRISRTNYGKIEIKIPSNLNEQVLIATILTTINQAIEKTEQLIAKYERIKTGLMQDLLTRGIDEQGNIRSEETHEFKDSVFGRIPKEWEVVKLSSLIYQLNSGVSVNSEDRIKGQNEIGILKTSCLSNCKFNFLEYKTVIKSDVLKAKTSPIKDNIIISRMNTPLLVGENAYVDKSYDDLFLPDRLWQTAFSDIAKQKLNVRYLSFYLSMPETRNKISLAATGTSATMKNISKGDFLSLNIRLPLLEEQIKICKIICELEYKINGEKRSLNKFNNLKNGLMNDLLTNKVSTQVIQL